MGPAPRELKRSIRQAVRERLRPLSAELRARASAAAAAQLIAEPRWINSKSVLLYIPLRDELDLLPCMEAARAGGKLVALPRYLPDQGLYCAAVLQGDVKSLPTGSFGIPEPPLNAPIVPLNRLDLAIVPGVAFDLAGRRLGRGKGFYDRLLADVTGLKCGVALDEQILPELPEEPHDMSMNFILTPTRFIHTSPRN